MSLRNWQRVHHADTEHEETRIKGSLTHDVQAALRLPKRLLNLSVTGMRRSASYGGRPCGTMHGLFVTSFVLFI